MKAGEYIGGSHGDQSYRWWVDSAGGVQHGVLLLSEPPAVCAVDKVDLRAAAAALVALAEERETETVEWGEEPHRYRLVTRPGTTYEALYTTVGTRGDWVFIGNDYPGGDIIAAFKAGQERGKP